MEKKKDFSNVGTQICSILFILFALVELQIMVNHPEQFIWFVGVGALILIDVYLLMVFSVKKKSVNQQKKEEQLELIQKSEKASYLLIKKYFQDLDERINRLEKTVLPLGSTIQLSERKMGNAIAESMLEERKVAKLLLGRSKESTEALLNGNGEIKASIEELEQKLVQMEERISSLNLTPQRADSKINAEQYQELLSAIRNMENNVKQQRKDADLNKRMGLDDIGALAAGVGEDTPSREAVPELVAESAASAPLMEPAPVFEAAPEVEAESIPEKEAAPLEEPTPVYDTTPEIEPAPAAEEEISMPERLDPNKVMSPDDIAALIESIGPDAPAPEAEEDTEALDDLDLLAGLGDFIPPEEEAPAKAAKAPAPDLSDPNKVMTPDEIAALIANL